MGSEALRSSARRSKQDMQVDSTPEQGVESSARAASTGDDDEHAVQKGPKAACVGCRNISECPPDLRRLSLPAPDASPKTEVRCVAVEPAGRGRCVRCTRLDLGCEWAAPQKRGRKPRCAFR